MCEYLRKIAVCFDFTKMTPQMQVQTFFYFVLFGQVRGNLSKFGGNLRNSGALHALI